ncbi:TPA: hypothetical protein DCZ39_03110 [Patescibacteria group bacterium]|nr:hypothetical protein [Candidatus Gracilibacteria bacterium]
MIEIFYFSLIIFEFEKSIFFDDDIWFFKVIRTNEFSIFLDQILFCLESLTSHTIISLIFSFVDISFVI